MVCNMRRLGKQLWLNKNLSMIMDVTKAALTLVLSKQGGSCSFQDYYRSLLACFESKKTKGARGVEKDAQR